MCGFRQIVQNLESTHIFISTIIFFNSTGIISTNLCVRKKCQNDGQTQGQKKMSKTLRPFSTLPYVKYSTIGFRVVHLWHFFCPFSTLPYVKCSTIGFHFARHIFFEHCHCCHWPIFACILNFGREDQEPDPDNHICLEPPRRELSNGILNNFIRHNPALSSYSM